MAPFYFLNLDPLFPYTAALAKRRHAHQGVQVLVPDDFCAPRAGTDSVIPSDCTIWKPNKASPLTINVHIVGAFWDRNEAGVPEELDPATELHGIANPPSTFGNTEGMVVLSDNPSLGARRRITNAGLCFGDHYAFASSPINVGFWQTERFTDAVPNLFAHELHHVLTGYVHPLPAPDPCHTVGVGTSTSACPRGFSMKMSPTQTVASECQRVIDGIPGIGDFTR